MIRYKIFVSDYDGTLAKHGKVSDKTVQALLELKETQRITVLVTGREMKDLKIVFPAYDLFDYIIAENGAVIHFTENGKEELLGPSPDPAFIESLKAADVSPLSVGKVIVATWVPHDKTVLELIKKSGSEHQVIFNKGAVMVLPPGINKATGLSALLHHLNMSLHNVVAVGDAENDTALLQASECAVAVKNAIPPLRSSADFVLSHDNGEGVLELVDQLKSNDLNDLALKMTRHKLLLGKRTDNEKDYVIDPHRSGILLSGSSGGGKSTFAASFTERLAEKNYQFCLIDPEGDYLELPNVMTVGNEKSLPTMEEIETLLINPENNVVICTLSVPFTDRPAFFFKLLELLLELREKYAHPHWILVDEAHHFLNVNNESQPLPDRFMNFLFISNAPEQLLPEVIRRVGMIVLVGHKPAGLLKKITQAQKRKSLSAPTLEKGEALVWDVENDKVGTTISFNLPKSRPHRHKKKYAQGDLKDKSFFFTGKEKKLNLKAGNLVMFAHIAKGIDDDTWRYHLNRKDFFYWFRDSIKDDDLAKIAEEARHEENLSKSKQLVTDFIHEHYTA